MSAALELFQAFFMAISKIESNTEIQLGFESQVL